MSIDENEFFRQATLRIFSSLNMDTALAQCMGYLKAHIPLSGMGLGLYDPDLKIGRIVAFIWPPHWKRPPDTLQISQDYWSWFEKEWGGEPGISIVNDVDEAEPAIRHVMSMMLPAEASHLVMDLELEKKRLGGLFLAADGKHRYTEEHARLIGLLHRPFAAAISHILQHQETLRLRDMLADDNRYLHRQLLEMSGDTIIGEDFGLKGVMEAVRRVAPLNSPILLLGETGAGKEVIANAIHYASSRKDNPFIKVNCGAIPQTLVDSELFGHEKGAFTGAVSRKRGRFERAHSGTIFLDEIAELPPAAQVRLLRVLQQHEIERVGGTETLPVDVRIISATHRNLEERVRSGRFREDLWYRLNVFPIMIPPLRQRAQDIPALVSYFIDRKTIELKMHDRPSVAPGAMERLQAYHWPGNVRELENLVERELIQRQIAGTGKNLPFEQLAAASFTGNTETAGPPQEVPLSLDELMANHIRKVLSQTNGRVEGQGGAARILGLHPSTLRGKMRKLGIPYGRGA